MHLKSCVCDVCMGICNEDNPTCGECFACEEIADNKHYFEANRADILGE